MLGFTWQWDHSPELPERQVMLHIEPMTSGSRLMVIHGYYGNSEKEQEDRQHHIDGWQHFLVQLQDLHNTVSGQATGEFDVDLKQLDSFAQGTEGINLGRMSIDKTFRGDLIAQSKGDMLSALTNIEGSAGYVAIEQVVGTLQGKQGGFVLQHFGMMHAGQNMLILEVVPNSGTGELETLSGKMTITIEAGKHVYSFDYSLIQDS